MPSLSASFVYIQAQGLTSPGGLTTPGQKLIDWNPKVTFKELVRIMVDADIKELTK